MSEPETVTVVGADGEALSLAEIECLITDVIGEATDRLIAALRTDLAERLAPVLTDTER